MDARRSRCWRAIATASGAVLTGTGGCRAAPACQSASRPRSGPTQNGRGRWRACPTSCAPSSDRTAERAGPSESTPGANVLNVRAMTEELDPERDRVVAVTGAGTGIGQAIAVKFGALGWRVAVGGRRAEKVAETAQLVEDAGGTCVPHALDVTDADSVEQFFGAVESDLGAVTAVVNNAATARYGPVDDFSPAEIAIE